MKALERLLERHLGLDCASLGPSALGAALSARMKETGVHSEAEYVALAQRDPAELSELVEEVVVPETWLMRDGEPFAELARLARRHTGPEPMRVLTLPCATGEEPCSVAVTLLEAGAGGRFAIDAVDVSRRALERAALGVFGERAFRGDDGGLRARWFTRSAAGWAIDPSLLRYIHFSHGNVLDAQLAGGRRYHAIFCRNLLIYLSGEARARALANLKRALAADGTLFVGHAEALERMDPAFARVGPSAAFSYRLRASLDEREQGPLAVRPNGARALPLTRAGTEVGRSLQFVTASPERRPAAERDLLEQAREHADAGRLADALALCERSLTRDPADPRAHELLGVVLSARGDLHGARASLERALYLDPEREETIAQLMWVHERLGDASRAEALSRRAERVRSRRGGGT